jgi:dihydrodipicolinate synthase/N-acetylneuraminate lyase
MDKLSYSTDSQAKSSGHSRGFAKHIAELALLFELTDQGDAAAALEAAIAEFGSERPVHVSTLKRCASEARALIEYAHASGAIAQIADRAADSEWRLLEELQAWLEETSLPAVLKERAMRLNRSRGGRPPTNDRTLRAVEELLEKAQAGQPGALAELRSIRDLVERRAS